MPASKTKHTKTKAKPKAAPGPTFQTRAPKGSGLPDLTGVPAHRRDTLLKDHLRHEGEEGRRIADCEVVRDRPAAWTDIAGQRTPNDLED